jgi:hypothetical protein
MRRAWWLLTAAAIGTLGCSDTSGPPKQEPFIPILDPPGFTTPAQSNGTITVVANDSANFNKPIPPMFLIQDLQFLVVRLETPEYKAPITWATMTFASPMGTLHENQLVPFSTDTTIKETMPPGDPRPVDVKRPKLTATGYAYDFAIAVAGTEIALRPQPGLWKVTAALEGTSVAANKTVELGGVQ